MANKIGWCSKTWNPVWGCLNHCEYCYARGIARFRYKQMYEIEFNHWKKFHPILKDPFHCDWDMDYLSGLKDFKPTFLNAQFDKKLPKKPQRIFVGSMSEIKYWDLVWIQKVLDKIKEYPQHTFIFLTKFPEVYNEWIFPKNCWLGVTITKNIDIWGDGEGHWSSLFNVENIKFISIEPILEKFTAIKFISNFDWVIIGAETGNRKDRVIPKREWIEDMVHYCRDNDIPIYLKDNLKEIYPIEIKEFPYLKGVRINV